MTDEEDARAEVRKLEREWMEAHQARDPDRLEELVADGFRFTAIHLHPEPMTREQWMGAALGGYTITTFAFEDVQIDIFGDTAVVHARYSQIASYSTVNLSNVFRLTDVWSKHTGKWQVVARHSSVLG
jgi:ketosteroid isomerase-like protein